jgi:hypothetical protein
MVAVIGDLQEKVITTILVRKASGGFKVAKAAHNN